MKLGLPLASTVGDLPPSTGWEYSAESDFRRDAARAVDRLRAPISGRDAMESLVGNKRTDATGDEGADVTEK
jgi:hypothetical protein